MDNVSAMSLKTAIPQGRAGPGIWERSTEGFDDFMQAILSRNETPAAYAGPGRQTVAGTENTQSPSVETDRVAWLAPGTDMDVKDAGIPSAAKGQEDLLLLLAQVMGVEDDGDFLYALEQYIADKPQVLNILEDFFNDNNSTRLLKLLDDLVAALRPKNGEDLPPELASLLLLMPDVPTQAPRLIFDALTGVASRIIPSEIVPVQDSQTPDEQYLAANIVETTETDAAPQTTIITAGESGPLPDVYEFISETETTVTTEVIAIPEGADEQAVIKAEVTTVTDTPELPLVNAGEPEQASGARQNFRTRVTYANMSFHRADGINRRPQPEEVPVITEPEAAEQAGPVRLEWMAETPAETEPPVLEFAETEPEGGTDEKVPRSLTAPIPAAAQAARQAAGTEPVSPARQALARSIIAQITQTAAQPGETTVLHMELHPKFLGKIQVILEAGENGITARLKSDNGAVRSLLNENLAELKEALHRSGINMDDVEVSETSVRANLADRQYQNQRREQAFWERDGNRPLRIQRFPAAQAEEPEFVNAGYTIGRVTNSMSETAFDYRA